jgi:phasin family protein
MLNAEQLIAAQKSNLETLSGLTAKAFEGVEQLVELNLAATRAALSESAENAQSALSVKDAQEFLALQAGLVQPLAEKAASYSRQLLEIAQGTGSVFTKAAEAQAADAQKKLAGLVDSASKNAPAGFESQVAAMKGAVAAANNAYESVQKAVKQATETAQANIEAATSQVVKASKTATAKKR